jgi:trehalose/maltose hydrolase-like predicted phosphorylase
MDVSITFSINLLWQILFDYRSDRLQKAKQKATVYGYKGAMFPWESDDTGEEATPTWALTGF